MAKHLLAPIRLFPVMISVFLIFLFIGVDLAINLNRNLMLLSLGISVTVFSASTLIKPPSAPLSKATERLVGPIAGAMGGILGGVTTIWGPPMLMLLVLLKLDKQTWIQTVGVIWFIGSISLGVAYWYNGILNIQTATLSALACIPGMIGIWLGESVRKLINIDTFRKILLITLFLIGGNLIRRGLF